MVRASKLVMNDGAVRAPRGTGGRTVALNGQCLRRRSESVAGVTLTRENWQRYTAGEGALRSSPCQCMRPTRIGEPNRAVEDDAPRAPFARALHRRR